MKMRFAAAVTALMLASACQQTTAPNGPDTNGAAVTVPCDAVVKACTPEQLGAWERAELARIEKRTAESAVAFVEATRLWDTGLSFSRNDRRRRRRRGGPYYNPSLLQCQPQRYQAQAVIIGPAGGTVEFGPHSLRIPAGALDHEVVITGEIEVSQHVLADLSPHGLTFATPAVLEFGYDHCRANNRSVRVAYVGDDLNILEWPVSQDNKKRGEVSAYIDHFSKYAVAY